GYGTQKAQRVAKAQKGQYKDQNFAKVKEFRVDDVSGYSVGQVITVEQFKAGDSIDVTGISKGKGFQGGVKRYGFHGSGPLHN
ncbi:50S ribosomal protein L3, partial [Staphylococcus pseudintermedius]|uniref:50S ribosomal protein L3 n=1 Tax=Staphylococcus pseudintermedius TaxID=283734 RepID=UPI0036F4231E